MPNDPVENLEARLLTLAGHLHATEFQLIKLLDEFDQLGGWQGDGIRSFTHWLNWKLGMGTMMAREKVRVARALRELPGISAAFSQGIISYSKVRAMSRVATPENESFLLQIAAHGTAGQMELLVRKYKSINRNPEDRKGWLPEKLVSWYLTPEDEMEFRVRLPKEDAEVVIAAINRIADELYLQQEAHQVTTNKHGTAENVSAETTLPDSCRLPEVGERRADALVCLAERSLQQDIPMNAPIRDVVVLMNANPEHPDCKVNDGPCAYTNKFTGINKAVMRRVTCEARITPVLQDDHGNILDIGRKSRVISPALRLALSIRDQGCRFPSCTQTRWTDAHHVQHWIDGGETNLSNLVTLCRRHHTALHRGEFFIDAINSGFRFRGRGGDYMPDCAWLFSEDAYDVVVASKPHQPRWNGDALDLDHALFCLDVATSKSRASL